MASPPIIEDSDIAARRAKMRIGVAVVLLAVAIGGLALLSRHKPEAKTEEPAQSEKQESISSGAGTAEAPTQINSAQQEAPPPAPATPAETPTEPPPPPPPAPIVSKLPPEPAHSAAPTTQRSVTPAENPIERPARLGPIAKSEPMPAKPMQQTVAEKLAPIPVSAPAKPEPKTYEVQVGVFTDMENAKQLQAKLAEHGIPSHTETKLQVGPFNTKAEADAAQVKLKAMGMGAVIVGK